MNRLTSRIWLAAVLMGCGFIGTSWIRSGYTFEVQPLRRGFDSLPLELNGYVGTEQPIDPEIATILNADTTVSRHYVRPDGSSILLHGSAWIRPDNVAEVAPHNPKICYVNAGWKILEERTVNLASSEEKLPICVLLLERDGERCVVGFWYQMGESVFTTTQKARLLHRQYWGKKKWPATMKFMLQTPSQGIDAAIPRIEEFALIVYQWSMEL